MNGHIDFHIPYCEEFREGYEAYNKREKKGPVYFEALSLILENWGNAVGMAKGISRLIRSWNYLYANFAFNNLVECIDKNLSVIEEFRKRNISSLSENDYEKITEIYDQFLDGLKRQKDGQKSAVSVAKALNPLAPNFFPLWDEKIAYRGYELFYLAYSSAPVYLSFCRKMKLFAAKVEHCVPHPDDRSLLKRIDEYNYSLYTKGWIKRKIVNDK